MLRYSKEQSAYILKDFECGIQIMDDFIHNSLDKFLKDNSHYSLYVVYDDLLEVAAMFVISEGIFVDNNGEFEDLPFGKPWAYFDDDMEMHAGSMYKTIEIDYLAVRKDLRENGYGTQIISEITKTAKNKNCYFLTVDAYHANGYSAIPFYEKQGFFAIQENSEEFDTLRMAKKV